MLWRHISGLKPCREQITLRCYCISNQANLWFMQKQKIVCQNNLHVTKKTRSTFASSFSCSVHGFISHSLVKPFSLKHWGIFFYCSKTAFSTSYSNSITGWIHITCEHFYILFLFRKLLIQWCLYLYFTIVCAVTKTTILHMPTITTQPCSYNRLWLCKL